MLIAPFHALVRGAGIADYWHNRSECFIVQSIALTERLAGHADRDRCPYCTMFDPPVAYPRIPKAK